MQLAAVTQAIEPSRHKMAPAVLCQQTTFRHLDAGSSGHERVGILDDGIPFGVLELFVLVRADPVELEQPVVEAGRRLHLPRAHFIRISVPRDNGFRPRTAGGSAHPKYLLQSIVPPSGGK